MIKYDKDEIREVQNFTISRKEFSMKFEDLKNNGTALIRFN